MQIGRRIAGALLALGLTVSLAGGCSTGSKSPDAIPRASDKPVELVLHTWAGIQREALDEVIDLYRQKHPNTKIKVKEAQAGQVIMQDGKLNTAAIESGDLVLAPADVAANWFKEGRLRDLSNIRLPKLNEAVAPVFDDLSKADGKRFGLPYTITPTVLMMNPKPLEAAGVKLPPVDWTVQDWDAIQVALKTAGVKSTMQVSFMLEPMVRAFGGQMYDTARGAWAFDTPEAKQGLAWIQKQVKDRVMQADSGKTVIMIGGPDAPAFSPMPGKMSIGLPPGIQIQPLPRGPNGRAVPVSAMVGAVLSSSANPEQAIDFLKEMISNPTFQMALAKGGVRPMIEDSKALAAWQEAVGDRTAQTVELSLQGAYVAPSVSMNQAISGLAPYFDGREPLETVVPRLISQLPH